MDLLAIYKFACNCNISYPPCENFHQLLPPEQRVTLAYQFDVTNEFIENAKLLGVLTNAQVLELKQIEEQHNRVNYILKSLDSLREYVHGKLIILLISVGRIKLASQISKYGVIQKYFEYKKINNIEFTEEEKKIINDLSLKTQEVQTELCAPQINPIHISELKIPDVQHTDSSQAFVLQIFENHANIDNTVAVNKRFIDFLPNLIINERFLDYLQLFSLISEEEHGQIVFAEKPKKKLMYILSTKPTNVNLALTLALYATGQFWLALLLDTKNLYLSEFSDVYAKYFTTLLKLKNKSYSKYLRIYYSQIYNMLKLTDSFFAACKEFCILSEIEIFMYSKFEKHLLLISIVEKFMNIPYGYLILLMILKRSNNTELLEVIKNYGICEYTLDCDLKAILAKQVKKETYSKKIDKAITCLPIPKSVLIANNLDEHKFTNSELFCRWLYILQILTFGEYKYFVNRDLNTDSTKKYLISLLSQREQTRVIIGVGIILYITNQPLAKTFDRWGIYSLM